MKKILALLLTAVMIMAFNITAFAAPAEPDPADDVETP